MNFDVSTLLRFAQFTHGSLLCDRLWVNAETRRRYLGRIETIRHMAMPSRADVQVHVEPTLPDDMIALVRGGQVVGLINLKRGIGTWMKQPIDVQRKDN